MSDPVGRPLVELDPNGTPTVLTYNVPEPTSYSGKNYIELSQLPQEAFTTVTSQSEPQPIPAPPGPGIRGDDVVGLLHPSLAIGSRPEVNDPDQPLVVSALEPATNRLLELNHRQLDAMVETGLRPVVFRGSGGLLDIRMTRVSADAAAPTNMTPHSSLTLRSSGGAVAVADTESKFLSLSIDSPAEGAHVSGPAAGVSIKIAGTWEIEGDRDRPNITLTVDGGADVVASVSASGIQGTWQATITLTSSGDHTIAATGVVTLSPTKKLTDGVTLHLNVQLDATADGGDPSVLPSITVKTPVDKTTIFAAATGVVTVTFRGTADSNIPNQPVGVEVADATTGVHRSTTVTSGQGEWQLELELQGEGEHALVVTAKNDKAASAPLSMSLVISTQQAIKRIVNRLLIVETLTLSSFLGAYGAGRVLRTFSLLPGERTTISLKTFTQSEESRKQSASILDSTASEASSEFDDSISREQTNKDAESESSNYKVGAEASATWGWGSAKVSAEFSGSANSAREEAVKNVKTATQKHASKASSNRSVTVNTDYEVKTQEKVEESTTREISNINVSRTLNFTFRQLNQEHIVLVHLTNARVAYYAQDLLVDSGGSPQLDEHGHLAFRYTYREVSLPELQGLMDDTIVSSWHGKVRAAVVRVLTGIPDYNDVLQAVVETAVPKDGHGDPVSGAEYLRFPRNLATTWEDPVGDLSFTVPGIVLSWDKITIRTDGVIVDSVLGAGDALDQYSHGLQDQALEERKIANAKANAQVLREQLAQKIIADKDDNAAKIFAQLFPPPPAPTIKPGSNG